MSSGVKVSDDVKTTIEMMKVKHSGDDVNKRIRILTLCIANEEIQVDCIYREEDLPTDKSVYKFLQSLMADGCCKYIVYDCHYATNVSKKEELVFIMWSSDNANVKIKMPYASSKAYLRKAMQAKHEFEFHALDDITIESFAASLAKIAKSDIQSVEGEDCCCRKK